MKNLGFDTQFIDKLKQNNDIVNVISQYVPLVKKGNQFWACCPFHYEKTPSFAINEQEQYYHCFGCNESGDVISFVQKYENVDFIRAVEILANKAGIEMPEVIFNENVAKLKKVKERILEINKAVAKFYLNSLYGDKGKNALDYLLKRNITKASLIRFGIGYSPDWTSLIVHLKGLGFSEQEMIDAGVAERKNGRIFDSFCERIMFPILNSFGDVLGFSGRTLSKDKNIAKYRNTRETLVFEKSKSIFGINLIKKYKQENPLEQIIIAEGQIDVIKIHQAGFEYAVACMGTALTSQHAKELKRFCDKVVVCFDGDIAGQKATMRSLDILCENGLNVNVVTLPDNKDPDEYISEFGKEKFENLINFAKPLVDFKIHFLSKKYNLQNNYDKTKFVNEALNVLKTQPSLIDAEIYLKTLHDLTDVSMDLLRQNLNINPIIQQTNLTAQPQNQENGYAVASKFILASLLHKKDYATFEQDPYFYFMNSSFNKLLEEIKSGIKVGNVFELFDLDQEKGIKDIINYNFYEDNGQQYYQDCVQYLIRQNIQKELDDLNAELKSCDKDKKIDILKKIHELSQKIININQGGK